MTIFSTLKEIELAIGDDKIAVMRNHPEIKHILKYAYDPFMKFFMTSKKSGLDEIVGIKNGWEINAVTEYILNDLSRRVMTGNKAQTLVCAHAKRLSPDSLEVFKRIINKDLRCGVNIISICKAFPGLIPLVWDGSGKLPFALCKTFIPEKAKYPLLVAIKKDGVRGQKTNGMVSRQGKPLIGHDHIESALEQFDFSLDGEICVPGMIFDEASGLIRNKEKTPESVFWVFDSPSIPGTKLERYCILVNHISNSMGENCIALIEHHLVYDEDELMFSYKAALDLGEEGIVIYDPDSEYKDGRIWWRLVPVKSEDIPVVGFFEGKGKHVGSLGGIIVRYKGHDVKVGTGFKEKIPASSIIMEADKTLFEAKTKKVSGQSFEGINPLWLNIRQFIWDNQDLFIGMIAEVEYKEKTKAGSLRQPRFKRWRTDK